DHTCGRHAHADAQTRPQAAHAAPAIAIEGNPGPARGRQPRALGGRRRSDLHLRYAKRFDGHRASAARAQRTWDRLQGPAHRRKLSRGDLREPRKEEMMNVYAIRAIYKFEMARWF